MSHQIHITCFIIYFADLHVKIHPKCITESPFLQLLFRHKIDRNLRQSYRNTSHPCSLLSLFQNRKIKSLSSTSASRLRDGLMSFAARSLLLSQFWKETYIHKRTTEDKTSNLKFKFVCKNILDLYKNMCIWIELFLISPNTVFSFIYNAQIHKETYTTALPCSPSLSMQA